MMMTMMMMSRDPHPHTLPPEKIPERKFRREEDGRRRRSGSEIEFGANRSWEAGGGKKRLAGGRQAKQGETRSRAEASDPGDRDGARNEGLHEI